MRTSSIMAGFDCGCASSKVASDEEILGWLEESEWKPDLEEPAEHFNMGQDIVVMALFRMAMKNKGSECERAIKSLAN